MSEDMSVALNALQSNCNGNQGYFKLRCWPMTDMHQPCIDAAALLILEVASTDLESHVGQDTSAWNDKTRSSSCSGC